MDQNQKDNDDFWTVALGDKDCQERVWRCDDSDYEGQNEDNEFGASDAARVVSYRIHWPLTNSRNDDDDDDDDNNDGSVTTLRLQPLPATDGIWSPVGAHAWYASALLAAFIIHMNDASTECKERRHPFQNLSNGKVGSESDLGSKVILELGSGAVGLSGFVAALALERFLQMPHSTSFSKMRWKVLLTDHDHLILDQLEKNRIEMKNSNCLLSESNVEVEVAAWDWNNDKPSCELPSQDEIKLVMGSELVYTQETGEACANLIVRLLQRNPTVEIWIVQVADRFGWWEVVVPTLENQHNICVENVPISPEIYDSASKMVAMGGCLDRYAYKAFCIHLQ